MGRAVDISSLDILPVDTRSSKGFGRNLVYFTCYNKNTLTNPFNNKTYDLPDQISSISSLPFSLFETRYSFDKDFESIKHTLAVDVGVNYKIGMFSASSSYQNSLVTIMDHSKYLASVDSYFSAFQVDFTPYWSSKILNDEFYKFIDTVLPDNYDGNEDTYNKLFQTYGTHFFSSGYFGGMYRMTFEINQQLLNTMTSTQIEANAKASFFNSVLNLTGDFITKTEQVSEEFEQNSKTIIKHYGGDVFQDDYDYVAWVQSIPGSHGYLVAI